jgi:D-xylose transport system ATP-binding protein
MLNGLSGRRSPKRRPDWPTGERAGKEALRLAQVTKWYGGVQALDRVSIAVDHGEVVALVGDNGAGKSTLVNILAGVVRADKGELFVEGERVDIASPAQARSLGIRPVHQEHKLADNLDVVENLFLGEERVRGAGALRWVDFESMRRPTENALSELGITTIADIGTRVAHLSGGQRQAVAVARATLDEYRAVLLDEPTAGLGVAACARVMEMVRRLRGYGCAVLIVSQNIDEIFEVADRIAVLHLGRLAAVFRRSETTPEAVVGAVMGMVR